MINLDLQVRRAVARDHRRISDLIIQESTTHRHLDWRTALEWVGSQNFWVLEDGGMIVAALACPEDPPDVAWIRLFSHASLLSAPDAWSALWKFVQADAFDSNPGVQIASIVMKQWFQSILLASGFEPRWNIAMLELEQWNYLPPPVSGHMRIHPMRDSDMDEVARVDREAFGPFWHNSLESLHRARMHSLYSSVAEDDNGVVGYQISTGNPLGAHLARLGVRLEAQGRGVGSTLINDLIQHALPDRSQRLSVNTQDDNIASLRLYTKLGFKYTGECYPVLVHTMGGV